MVKVFVSDTPNRQNIIKVWRADREYNADLSFFEVDADYKATSETLWFFVKRDYESKFHIYWVDREYEADLKVFKVDRDYNAKWLKSHKLRNRLE